LDQQKINYEFSCQAAQNGTKLGFGLPPPWAAATLKNHGKFSGPNLALKFHGLLPQEVI
jgi:hypothetical protein